MKALHSLILLIGLFINSSQLFAKAETIEVIVNWHWDSNKSSLSIDLSGALKNNQIKTLNSGFSTYSQLRLHYFLKDNDEFEILKTSCTVKYDAWLEEYEITKLDNPPQAATVKTLEKYFNFCLKSKITDPRILIDFQQGGGEIFVTLRIEQISKEQSSSIKDWLINQQSGVMQGLFSHMLEGLTLNETLNLILPIQARPAKKINQTSTPKIQKAG